jgi:hypothetical protein
MSSCFLSCSESYRPVMETIRRLLETLEFQVDVFDGPDPSRPPLAEFQHRLLAADCVAILFGLRARDRPVTPTCYRPCGSHEADAAPWDERPNSPCRVPAALGAPGPG